MDEDPSRSAWPLHSYENISNIHECYESVARQSHIGAQTRAIPLLMHKARFAYECLIIPRRGWPLRVTSVCPAEAGDIGIYGRVIS